MTQKILLHPSDRLVDATGYDVQIQPITEPNPAISAYRQSLLGRNVMLWINGKTVETLARYPALIQEAKKYQSIKSVYLYDEWGWNDGAVQIGLHEAEVLWAADIAFAAGLETVISINPQVALHPQFKMRDINKFSMIAFDPYPAIGVIPSPGCQFNENPYSTMLFCCYQKVLALGYRGKIGYIAQGFARFGDSYDQILMQLTLQKQTMNHAIAMGVQACMWWGTSLGQPELRREPFLIPLAGTAFEHLVRFD